MKITRKSLEKTYNKFVKQSGDTELDFYEWAIGWLIVLYNDLQKEVKE